MGMNQFRQDNWPSANISNDVLIQHMKDQKFHLVELFNRTLEQNEQAYEWCIENIGPSMIEHYDSGSSRLFWADGTWCIFGCYPPGHFHVFFENHYDAMAFAMRWR